MNSHKVYLLILFFCLSFVLPVFSQEPPAQSLEQQRKAMEEKMRREEEKMLEQLKKENPLAYKDFLERREREEKKRQIIEAFRQGKLSKGSAKDALTPLLTKEIDVNSYVKGIDEQIKMLQNQIERLRNIKQTPSLLIGERAEQYLR